MNRQHLFEWLLIATLAAATTTAMVDAGRMRTARETDRINKLTDQALGLTPFSKPITVIDINPSTHSLVLRMNDTRLGSDALFLAKVQPQATIASYQPILEDDIVIGFSERERVALESIVPGTPGIASLRIDTNGEMQLLHLVTQLDL